ncbi:hypothetical protein Dimus_036130 [Dionaea muscipula]
MGRRKKKPLLIPLSHWTPIVAGMSSDASDVSSETSDLGISLPLKPLEEADERISEDDSCPSSNGDSESTEVAMDDEVAELNDAIAELAPNSEILQLPDNLRFHGSRPLPPDLAHAGTQEIPQMNPFSSKSSMNDVGMGLEDLIDGVEPNSGFPPLLHPGSQFGNPQVNPNSSNSSIELCSSINLISNGQDTHIDLMLSRAAEGDLPCQTGVEPSAPSNATPSHDNVAHASHPTSNFKGKWSNLFADNRKPIDEYMLKKTTSTAGSAQYMWKPRTQKKQTAWQRVSVPNSKPHNAQADMNLTNLEPGIVEDDKNSPNSDPCLNEAYLNYPKTDQTSHSHAESESNLPCDSLHQVHIEPVPCITGCSSSEQAFVQHVVELPHHDPLCSKSTDLELHDPHKEGFKKVPSRRRNKSSRLKSNPEQ